MCEFEKNLLSLQKKIGYTFRDTELLCTAMTHTSFVNDAPELGGKHNERLEFLGDAVLELVVSSGLYEKYPDLNEGDMTKTRATAVCEAALFEVAKKFGIDHCIRLGNGEEITGGRRKPSILSDAVEALIGAIYLDGGIDHAAKFINSFTDLDSVRRHAHVKDNKTRLQEHVQRRHLGSISYKQLRVDGPPHDPCFTCAVYVDEKLLGTGMGHSKKEAEMNAASEALKKYNAD